MEEEGNPFKWGRGRGVEVIDRRGVHTTFYRKGMNFVTIMLFT